MGALNSVGDEVERQAHLVLHLEMGMFSVITKSPCRSAELLLVMGNYKNYQFMNLHFYQEIALKSSP